jgi:KipI family sensor histidine kinase inhibitor
MDVRFLSCGDTGLVVEFGDRVDRALSDRVLALSARVRRSETPGVIETVPTYRSLLVIYDPLIVDRQTLIQFVRNLVDERSTERATGKIWRIPACYELSHAPDLEDVAQRTNRSIDDVRSTHAQTCFHVYMIGFAPGHPYLGDLPDWLSLPRRSDPRVKVPAGSIAIAGNMSVIYPMETPGGWHLIGATPVRLFDVNLARPALISPGDQVRFDPVTASEFDAIRRSVAAGSYRVPFEDLGA